MATAKFFSFACLRNESSNYGELSPKPHYPSMPKYPKGVSVSTDEEKSIHGTESKAVFSVNGMSCSACAGSVEKAIKRLPGIKEAVVDVLNNKAQVIFYSTFVDSTMTCQLEELVERVGVDARRKLPPLMSPMTSRGGSLMSPMTSRGGLYLYK